VNTTACLGVGCEQRRSCAGYALVEWSDPRTVRMSFCPVNAKGEHTRYQPLHVPMACVASERRATA
jgi:hypothetical protein